MKTGNGPGNRVAWNVAGLLIALICVAGCGGGGGNGTDTGFDAGVPVDAADGYVGQDALTDTGNQELPPSSTMPVFDPTIDDFYALPFPSNTYRNELGNLELWNFPNPAQVGMLDYILGVAEEVLDGFSVVQVVYLPFSEGLDTSFLPSTWIPGDAAMALQLVDVTDGPDYGDRLPLTWEFRKEEGLYIAANTLMIRPLWGYTLKEGHTYAALATSELRGADGGLLTPAPYFLEALDGSLAGNDAMIDALAPLKGLLDKTPELAAKVVTGTVFTVGYPSTELHIIRKFLHESVPPPELVAGSLEDKSKALDISYYSYEGQYVAPNFLKGNPPYNEEGGFEFDDNGDPVVQFDETMRFALIIPKKLDMPPDGWPIVIYSHGTGGDYNGFIKNPGVKLAKEGFAAIGINQPLHGDRVDPPLAPEILELYSFNFLNVEAGRTVQRQSVPDNISLLRMIEAGNLVVPEDLSAAQREEKIDPTKILFFGHSQGGLTGGMLFGVEDHFDGGVISGAGGGMPMTIVLRKDPLDLKVFVGEALAIDDPAELTEYHPVLSVLQMLVDATDPIAYGHGWFEFDEEDPLAGPRNVMMTEGMEDPQTPAVTAEALAAAAGIPVIKPFVRNPDGLIAKKIAPVGLPLSQNIDATAGAKATGFLMQFPGQGHYPVFNDDDAIKYYREFLHTLAYEGVAKVSQ